MITIDSLLSYSILETQFREAIKNDDIKVVSFDIFDTLVFRKCAAPTDVFTIAGRHPDIMSHFDSAAVFAHYRKNGAALAQSALANGEEASLADIYRQIPASDEQREEFQAIEIDTENNLIVANPQTDRWIQLAHDAGKRVILISDMYLSVEKIRQIAVSKLQNANLCSTLFVSSEYGVKKLSGHLFVAACRELGIRHDELLHIGDHPLADIAAPLSMGIHTLPYRIQPGLDDTNVHERYFLKQPLICGEHTRLLAALMTPYHSVQEQFFFHFGATVLGPAMWAFSHWLLEIAAQHKIDKIFFLLREGNTFHHCINLLSPNFDTDVVFASRQSTILAATAPEKISEATNFNVFHEMRIGDLYETLQLEITHADIARNRQTLCKDANNIPTDHGSLQQLFSLDLLARKSELTSIALHQQQHMLAYLTKLSFTSESALVDFGGGGTVIGRLFDTLPPNITPKLGILFFRHPQGYRKLCGHHVLSFLPPTEKGCEAIVKIARSCDVIEILLNGTAPYTISYSSKGPVTRTPASYTPMLSQAVHAARRGVETFFAVAGHYDISGDTWDAETIGTILLRVIDYPTRYESQLLGALTFDEGRGSQAIRSVIDDKQLSLANQIGVHNLYEDFLKNISYETHTFPWIQGVITRLDPSFLKHRFGARNNPNEQVIHHLVTQVKKADVPIIIFGAGELFTQMLPELRSHNIQIDAVVDSRAEAKTFEVMGHLVVPLKDALRDKSNATVVIASAAFTRPIKDKIQLFAETNQIRVNIIAAN